MINRELQNVDVITYDNTLDDYGQLRQSEYTTRTIPMVCKIYSQTNTNDMRYVDVEMIGITKDKDITNENEIKIGDTNYQVLYVIPSSRYYQVLMRKK